jgi:POT family proton-dependent oligopeptide transporter
MPAHMLSFNSFAHKALTIMNTQTAYIAKTLPNGCYALASMQLFSTIGFAVLWSTLVLYLTQSLQLSDGTATGIVATFSAFNYGLHLLGGYMGGRLLSFRKLFIFGVLLQVLGCLTIAYQTEDHLYWGLALFLAGSGLNVTCINMMLTQLFAPEDKRREGAFLLNYSMMNLGFMVGFMVAGHYQLGHDFHRLFIFAGYGSAVAIVLALLNWHKLKDRTTSFAGLSTSSQFKRSVFAVLVMLLLVLSLKWLVEHASFSNNLVALVGLTMLAVMIVLALRQPTKLERNKIFAYIILSVAGLSFFVIYQMLPMSLTLFAERNVDLHFLGYTIAPQWIQNINAGVIIVGGPLLALLFKNMRAKGIAVSIPLQFSASLVITGIGVVLLPIGIAYAKQGITHFNWVIATYVLQSIGELLISPIGYAMVGQLAPARLQGVMMGTWMMVTGVAATLVHYLSHYTLDRLSTTDPVLTNPAYSYIFNLLGTTAICFGILLLLISPWLKALIGEKKT